MYCPHCNVYIDQDDILGFSISDSDSYSFEEDPMSESDDYFIPRAPAKRSRSEAKLSTSSDENDRPRKRVSPVPSEDAMMVDGEWMLINRIELTFKPFTSTADPRGSNSLAKKF